MPGQLQRLIMRLRSGHGDGWDMLQAMYHEYAQGICSLYITDKRECMRLAESGLRLAYKYIHSFDHAQGGADAAFREWLRKKMVSVIVAHLRNGSGILSFVESELAKQLALCRNRQGVFPAMHAAGSQLFSGLPSSAKLVIILTEFHGFTDTELAQCFNISLKQARFHQTEIVNRVNGYL